MSACACSRVVRVVAAEKAPAGWSREMADEWACPDCHARFMRHAPVDPRREATAATILAGLTQNRMVADDGGLDDADRANVRYAVALTDALRAELAKGKP